MPSPQPLQSPRTRDPPAFLQLPKADVFQKFVDLEWQQRNRLLQGVQQSSENPSPWARLSGEEIMKRNRYLNIDPWANNRICLRVPEGQNDYINASPITLQCSKTRLSKKYIATQGPKESSTGHFWNMIWHELGHVGVVIMLTQTHEAGREKCFRYFPLNDESKVLEINENSETDHFTGTVELLESKFDDKTRSTIRKLCLTSEGATKTVWHYLFEGWPDFSVPEADDRRALLELIKDSFEKARSRDNARVVHCSAGVGRSGTFIALDYLLGELADGALDDVADEHDRIADTVNELRKQRMMMVQGDAQFDFLYEVMRERWFARHDPSALMVSSRPDEEVEEFWDAES